MTYFLVFTLPRVCVTDVVGKWYRTGSGSDRDLASN